MHILSSVTANCFYWISGWERMGAEIISWSISTKVTWPSRGSNSRPLDLQSAPLPTALWCPAYIYYNNPSEYSKVGVGGEEEYCPILYRRVLGMAHYFSSRCIYIYIAEALLWSNIWWPFLDIAFLFLHKNIHYENTPIQIYWKFYNQTRKMFR